MKDELDVHRYDNQARGPIDAEELRRTTSNKWSARYSLPLDVDSTLCVGIAGQEEDTVSTEYIDRLILLTSKARSWRAPDDETVDLTEPRFESFCMANVKSP